MTTSKTKLILLGAIALSVPALNLRADIISSEPFLTGVDPGAGEYTPGIAVGGQDPTVIGYLGAWVTQNGGNVGAVNVVLPNSLAYSSPGYSTSGGSVAQQVDNGRYGRIFDNSNPFQYPDDTFYMSFLLQSSGNGGYMALELNTGGFDDSARSLQVGLSSFGDFGATSNYAIRVNNNAGLVGDFGSFDTNAHLFVVKFQLSSLSGGDSITAWMDPTLGGSDPAGGITLSGFDLNTTDALALATFAGPQTGFDEIRFGTTFQDVTVPEPSTVALLAGGFCLAAGVAWKSRRRRMVE